ncbi:hypothetical protein AAMO2058_000443100 [Amorphochlora amoebiformis]
MAERARSASRSRNPRAGRWGVSPLNTENDRPATAKSNKSFDSKHDEAVVKGTVKGRFGHREYEIFNPKQARVGNLFKLKDKEGNLYAAKTCNFMAQKKLTREAMQYFHMDPHQNVLTIADIAHVLHMNQDLKLLVMPWATVGNIKQCLSCCVVTKNLRMDMCKQMAEGVRHLHGLKPPMLHLNLKPENVMMFVEGDRLIPKVTDFGPMGSGAPSLQQTSDPDLPKQTSSNPTLPSGEAPRLSYGRKGSTATTTTATTSNSSVSMSALSTFDDGENRPRSGPRQTRHARKKGRVMSANGRFDNLSYWNAPEQKNLKGRVTPKTDEYLQPYGYKTSKKIQGLARNLGLCLCKYTSARPTLPILHKVISTCAGKKRGKFKFEFKRPAPNSPVREKDSRKKRQAKIQDSEKQIRFTQFLDSMFNNRKSSIAYKFYTRDAERGDAKAQYNLANCYSKGIGMEKNSRLAVKWYNASAVQGNPEAQNDLALCYQHGRGVDKEEKIAFQWFSKSAAQKYTLGQFNLGVCYERGIGTETDLEKAASCYRLAAEQGSFEAMVNLGICYEHGDGVDIDQKKAFQLFLAAADQGDPMAQFNVALCYQKGIGVEENMGTAIHWYQKAGEAGYAQAQCNLAVFHQQGIGIDKDEMIACKWYITSAAQGYAEAQNNLAICYEHGIGVPADPKLAVQWYTEASLQGHAEAQFNLGNCYRRGVGVEKDLHNAFQWYSESAEKSSHPDAMFRLSQAYHLGHGVDPDENQAVIWCHRAAEKGHIESCYNIAICFHIGHIVQQDDAKAFAFFRGAAEAGHVDSMYNLGKCYDEGLGTDKDSVEARKWYETAANEGHPEANDMLVKEEN